MTWMLAGSLSLRAIHWDVKIGCCRTKAIRLYPWREYTGLFTQVMRNNNDYKKALIHFVLEHSHTQDSALTFWWSSIKGKSQTLYANPGWCMYLREHGTDPVWLSCAFWKKKSSMLLLLDSCPWPFLLKFHWFLPILLSLRSPNVKGKLCQRQRKLALWLSVNAFQTSILGGTLEQYTP